ncbi:hypothetical protein JYT25_00900 [bacterium AH-315-C20]|nr:hypothetical protein [bacterium AH-315-C20]
MSEENKYMDDSFREMSENYQSTYHSEYWAEMESQLNDESLDDAFKVAAASSFVVPSMPDIGDISENMSNAFMDDAFKEAASQQQAAYSTAYFSEFESQKGDLEMNDAFTEASNATTASYSTDYWPDADVALRNEGLHYEYNPTYWAEAKSLLDIADRTQFFIRWSSVATILLLLSFLGLNGIDFNKAIAEAGQPNANSQENTVLSEKHISTTQADASYDQLISAFDAGYNSVSPIENNPAINYHGVAMINHPDNNDEKDDNVNYDSPNYVDPGPRFTNPHNRFLKDQPQLALMAENEEELDFDMNLNSDVVDNNDDVVKNDDAINNVHAVNNDDETNNDDEANNNDEANNDDVINNGDMNPDDIRHLPLPNISHDLLAYTPTAVTIEKYTPRPSHTFSLYGSAGIGREYGANYLEATRRLNGDLFETDVKISTRIKKPYEERVVTGGENDGFPLYKFSIAQPTLTAQGNYLASVLDKINIVPNPYYAYSAYETTKLDNRVKITNIPERCTITIFNMQGGLVRVFEKDDPLTSVDWDLKNHKGIPIAGGVYLIHIEVEIDTDNDGVMETYEKVIKWYGALRETDLDNL